MAQSGIPDGGEQYNDSMVITPFLATAVVLLIILQIYRTRKGFNVDMGQRDTQLAGIEVIPGARSWDPTGLIGNSWQLLPIQGALQTALKWGNRYGDTFKFRMFNETWITLNSGPAVQSLCRSTDMGHLRKSPQTYDRMKPYISNGLLVSTGALWQRERKLLLKSQSYLNLKAYMPLLNRHFSNFVSQLGQMFEDGEPHKINDLINNSFIKVTCEMITGFSIKDPEECTQYYHNVEFWKETSMYLILHPWLLLPPIWKLHPMSRKQDKAINEMSEFARRRIREHKEKRVEREQDLMNGNIAPPPPPFRSVLDELVDGGVEEEQIVEEIHTMIFGGHETVSTVIHFFFFCIALNPEIQEEVRKEVDELFEESRNFEDESDAEALTFEGVTGRLKLLERCMLETLRLFPPVFVFSRKLDAPLTINVNGQDVLLPTGTNAAVCPYILHRREEYFPQPEKFNPDRFLPEEVAKRHAYSFVPFSAGPRNCLGMKFAMMELKAIAAYTLRHFVIKTTDRMEDIPVVPCITTKPAKDYTFQFLKRDKVKLGNHRNGTTTV